MRRVLFLGLLMVVGCQNTTGPFSGKKPTGKIDQPLYNIELQKQRARERSSLPLDDPNITPNSYSGQYGPYTGPPVGRN